MRRLPAGRARRWRAMRLCPWRTWEEWDGVRAALLAPPVGGASGVAVGAAAAAAWRARGRVPAAAEATAALATLLTERATGHASAASAHSWRLATAMALARLANAVADAQQTRRHAQPVAALAAAAGLPRAVVDVRHEATHNVLPGTAQLEDAARQAMVWLAERYWGEQLAALRAAGSKLRSELRAAAAAAGDRGADADAGADVDASALAEAIGADGRFAARALLARDGLVPSGSETEGLVAALRAAAVRRPQLVPCLAEEAVALAADPVAAAEASTQSDVAELAWWAQALLEGRCGAIGAGRARSARWAAQLRAAADAHLDADRKAEADALKAAAAAAERLDAGGSAQTVAGEAGGGNGDGDSGDALAAAEQAHARLLAAARARSQSGAKGKKRKRQPPTSHGPWTLCDSWEPRALGDVPDEGLPPPPWRVGDAHPAAAREQSHAPPLPTVHAGGETDGSDGAADVIHGSDRKGGIGSDSGSDGNDVADTVEGDRTKAEAREQFAGVLDMLGDLAG